MNFRFESVEFICDNSLSTSSRSEADEFQKSGDDERDVNFSERD